jgi:hypothetical protein
MPLNTVINASSNMPGHGLSPIFCSRVPLCGA